MATLVNQVYNMAEHLKESDLLRLIEFMEQFLPDDVVTPEDAADIKQAHEEYLRGETINAKDIDWDNLEDMDLS
ncbi:hypothetical protein AGMMS49975_23110 [Clostridia bacterium]|nr:hypothetical protein AGMMS49975_23110 [Clostridia bacterium]